MKTKEKFSFLQSFLKWREKHITDKQFILILSFLVGIFTALAAFVLLKTSIPQEPTGSTLFILLSEYLLPDCLSDI